MDTMIESRLFRGMPGCHISAFIPALMAKATDHGEMVYGLFNGRMLCADPKTTADDLWHEWHQGGCLSHVTRSQ